MTDSENIPPRVIRMIEMRRQGSTLEEIGAYAGVTRERARQLLKQHGGPSTSEVRQINEAREREQEAADAEKLRLELIRAGPGSASDLAERTGLNAARVRRLWPKDLDALRLYTVRSTNVRWTEEETLGAIRDAALYEYPLTTTGYADLLACGQITGPSLPRIWQIYGSWSSACDAAGVIPGSAIRDNYQSRWSDSDILAIVRKYLLDPDAPNSFHGFDKWKQIQMPDGPSGSTIRNRLGNWRSIKMQALSEGFPRDDGVI